jgi:hypothetical protein
MINLEMAKKLKEAGLKWEPQELDYFYWKGNRLVFALPGTGFHNRMVATGSEKEFCTWLPCLDQILIEIEKLGLNWNIGNDWQRQEGDKKYCMGLFGMDGMYVQGQFYGKTPEDAAAKALLWIYETGGNAE